MLKQNRAGTSLLELMLALVLIGTLTYLGTTSYASARNVFAVRAARDAVVAASARTRAFAIRHGGGTLQIDVPGRTLRITTRDGVIDETSAIASDLAVRIQLDGARSSGSVPYDALGIGRIASRTITLTSGTVVGGVTFSSYGRPREW
jgi:type II secretory pathway pseudopilin PulG